MQKIRPVTGERADIEPIGGFNAAWQRHAAEYALVERFLPPGRTLDLGCGMGHSHDLLAPRSTVGVDIDHTALCGQNRPVVCADMRRLPFLDGSFDSVLSSHSLEHVPNPTDAVAEAARVTRPGGCVVFGTPNRLTFGRPDEIIDPYHHVELDPEELRAVCAPHFDAVELWGVFGSPRYMQLHDGERRKLAVLLRCDPLRVRRLVPRRARQVLYDALLRRSRRTADPLALSIGRDDFTLGSENLEASLDLVAVCWRGGR